ncbi:unnamed protein product [Caenorhabditis brenneri]
MQTTTRMLFNSQEMRNINGKIRGLNQLTRNQRIRMPRLQHPLLTLMHHLHYIAFHGCFPFNDNLRRHIRDVKDITNLLEDFLIRVVIRGDEIDQVLDDLDNSFLRQLAND